MLSVSNPSSLNSRRVRDSGHLLLAILLMMALMVIAAMYEAPRLVQQMKRDREEEMIHRGTEYARAIKKFYKKFGNYPSSLEQLDKTNNIRFIRKRYKDPLTKNGKWTLLHYGDIAMMMNASAPGQSAASLASGALGATGQQSNSGFGSSGFGSSATTSGGFGTSTFGSGNSQAVGQQGGSFNQQQSQSGLGQSGTLGSTFGSGSGQNPTSGVGTGTTATGTSGTSSTTGSGTDQSGTGSNTASGLGQVQGVGGQFGGGAIVGVASLSKDPTIRIYNKKKTYNEWQFIYNPQMDQQNVLLRGPYSPSTLIGNTNIGTPAGQLNQQNQQQSPFGQSGSSFGNQQQGGFGNQQPVAPGGQQSPQH
jgi:hypothetical protein